MVLACSWKLEERCSEIGKITYCHPLINGMSLSGNSELPVLADGEVSAAGHGVLKAFRRTSLD